MATTQEDVIAALEALITLGEEILSRSIDDDTPTRRAAEFKGELHERLRVVLGREHTIWRDANGKLVFQASQMRAPDRGIRFALDSLIEDRDSLLGQPALNASASAEEAPSQPTIGQDPRLTYVGLPLQPLGNAITFPFRAAWRLERRYLSRRWAGILDSAVGAGLFAAVAWLVAKSLSLL